MEFHRSFAAVVGGDVHTVPQASAAAELARNAEYCAIALIFLLANYVVLTKAAHIPFTYDEAYSDLVYAQSWDGFRQLNFANNHPLNSFAMYVMSRIFGHEPFALRIPNILSFYVFAASAFLLCRKLALPAFAFAALTMNALLLEFFSLARGYGISAAFALAGFAALHLGPPARPLLVRLAVLALLFVSAAAYSPMAVGILAAACIFMLRDVRSKQFSATHIVSHLVYVAVFLYFTRRVAQVSAEGLPLYATSHVWQSLAGPGHSFMPKLVTSDMLLDPNLQQHVAGAVFLMLLLLLPALALLRSAPERVRSDRIEAAVWCALIAIGTIAIPAMLGRKLPLARTLLPFIPIWLLGVLICCQPAWRKLAALPALGGGVSIALAGLVTMLCLNHTSLSETHHWPHEKSIAADTIRAVTEKRCAPPALKQSEAFTFYLAYHFAMGRDDLPVCPR